MIRGRIALPIALAAILAIGLLPAVGQTSFDFMPDGGRGLLSRVAANPEDLAEIAAASRSLDEWRDRLAALKADLTPKEIDTIAGYLSVNMPLDSDAKSTQATADLAAVLPPDGKQLAIDNCQFCHSIFSSYLMQDRDIQGWRSIFQSPFHREIKMTARERETFALYSAANMPLNFEDVPPELRF